MWLNLALCASVAIVCAGCRRASSQALADGSGINNDDAGDARSYEADASDGGVYSTDAGDAGNPTGDGGVLSDYDLCPPDAGPPPPALGGLTWRQEALPTVTSPQDAGWVVASSDPECSLLIPGTVPPSLKWIANATGAACSAATVDGQGDLSIVWTDGFTALNSFFPATGTDAQSIRNGAIRSANKEDQLWVAPAPAGFALLSHSFNPWCTFLRTLTPAGAPGLTSTIDAPDPDQVREIEPNPLGGYVVLRTTADGKQPSTQTLDVRFVDQQFQALGEWHTVTTYHRPGEDTAPAYNITWSLTVDQRGRALVLTFAFPPSFGPPAAPSTWRTSARWMEPRGPLTEEFQPVVPIFTPNKLSDGSPLFAFWGTILPLSGGGFAAFHDQLNPATPGTISPTGWYAFYPSGEATVGPAPGWLDAYDGSLQMLADGAGYTAVAMNEPQTCARTVLLIAQSGRTCYTLPVAGTDTCTSFRDALWPDGTLVLQNAVSSNNNCMVQWWPGLSRPGR